MSFRFILKTIIIFIGLIFCLPVVALAAEVRINPAVTTVAVDSQVAVSVDIDNVENLFAVSFDLFFDPAILEFISAEEGGFFNESGAITTFLVDNSQPGDLLVYYERTDGVPSEVSGSGIIMTFNFHSLAAGSSELIFGNNFLYNETPADWFGGTITVETSQPAPDTTSPVTPSDLTAIAVSASQIDLSWSIPEDPETAGQITSGLAGYRVYRDGTEIATTTDLFYSDIGLTASTTYSYTITIFAFDSAENESDQSEPVSVATLAEIIPATVSILPASTTVAVGSQVTVAVDIDNVEDLIGASFDLFFDPAILNFDSFQDEAGACLVSADSGDLVVGCFWEEEISGSSTLLALTFNTLSVGTSSLVFVANDDALININWELIFTVWDDGEIIVSELSSAPDTTSPVTPSDLTAIAVSASQIDLSWSIPEDPETAGQITSGLAGYRVYRDGTEIATTTDLFYSDIGLTASTTYSYTITIFAFDSAENESDQSEPVSVATLAEIIPATVSILPASTTVVVGLQVTVSIDIDNVEDLFAVAFDLVFDSDILSFVSAQKGTFLEQDGFATDLSASFLRDPQENIIDPGRLIVGYSRLAGQGGSIGASGSGNLMTLTFEAVATGTSSLAFQKTHFFNSSLDEILTNWNNGLVEAGTPSECASFVYTGWSSCQANNTQARTVVSSLPCGCFGGSPVLSQSCVYIPPSAVYPMGDTINILPPELSVSNVSVKNTETTENNIIIYWTTSYPASSQVVYSKDGESHALDVDDEKFGYARATPEFDTPPNVNGTTTHSVIIEDLVPGATYYFRTVSRGSLAMSQEYSFVALLKTSNIETEIKGEVIEMVALNESQISEQKEMPQDEGQTKVGFTETIKENYFEKRGEQPSEAELPGNNSISENALGAVGSPNNLMATAGLFSGKINQSVLLIFSAVGILLLILTILVLFSKKCKNIISNLFYNIKK